MPSTISGRAFNQDTAGAKRAAAQGPVFITDRGRPAHVLLTYADYAALLAARPNLADALAQPDGEDIEFDPAPLSGPIARPADFD